MLRIRSTVANTARLARINTRPTLRTFSSLHTRDTQSKWLPRWWLNFSERIPRGFQNFYNKKKSSQPKKSSQSQSSGGGGGDKKPPKTDKSNKGSSDKGKNSSSGSKKKNEKKTASESSSGGFGGFGGSGGGATGGGGPAGMPKNLMDSPWVWSSFALGFGAMVLWPMLSQSSMGPEITFQEFQARLLEERMVERIEIINKHTVRVFVHERPAQTHINLENEFDHEYADMSSSDHIEHHDTTPSATAPIPRLPKRHVFHFKIGSVDTFEAKLDMVQRELGFHPHDFVPVKYTEHTPPGDLMLQLLPIGVSIALLYVLMQSAGGMGGGSGLGGGGRNIFSMGKSNATVLNKGEKVTTTFKDVAGLGDAKMEIMEFVKFLQKPERFTKLGAQIPKGALLVGPPGTGKTLLARATAGEAKVPFFSVSGSDFVEMFVGVGPARVRDLFAQARSNAPCIIFIDEIDAVGRARGKGKFGGNDERENTLNQMLVEMDGFKSTSGVVVLAGTNRADILDKALLRPGRFDRQILIDKPDLNGRVEIFRVHLSKLKLGVPLEDVAQRVAALTPGYSGADIANVCNEAALLAARKGKDQIDLVDFESANDRIIGGLEKDKNFLTPNEKRLIAYHEAGHAVMGWFLEHADPLLKVTVIPRSTGALGFAQYLPKEVPLYNTPQLYDQMCMTLGGRASEQIFFDEISTGAADDLKKVTQLAYSQVSIYGMSDAIGHLSFPPDDQQFVKPYSDHTAMVMDNEVKDLVQKAYKDTIAMLKKHREDVKKVAEKLLEKETITHDDVQELLGPRPHQTDAYKMYLEKTREFQEKYGTSDEEKVVEKMSEELHSDASEEDSSERSVEEEEEEEEEERDEQETETEEQQQEQEEEVASEESLVSDSHRSHDDDSQHEAQGPSSPLEDVDSKSSK